MDSLPHDRHHPATPRDLTRFTLGRLVLAVAILLVLALVVPPAAAVSVHRRRVDRARRDVDALARAMRTFLADVRPAGASGLGRAPVVPDVDLLCGPGAAPKSAAGDAWLVGRTDTLANQLIVNAPRYPAADSGGWWRGPYLRTFPGSDPWGNRYLVNAAQLGDRGERKAVWVLSAGPNGIVETAFQQPIDRTVVGGDDIAARVR